MTAWLTAIVIAVGAVLTIAAFVYGAIVFNRGNSPIDSRLGTGEIVGDRQLSWSPVDAKVAFTSDRDGNEEIYVRDLDTDTDTRLTNDEASDSWPRWSPDGSRIAFLYSHLLGPDIYVVDADGTNKTNLTNHGASYGAPVWSPDGTRIAFTSDRDLRPALLSADTDPRRIFERLEPEIYVMDADGTNQTRLTFNQDFDGGISWSPDGSRLAFHSDRDGDHDIYVIDADGGGLTRLTDNDWSDISPAWSPDGSRIAFASKRPLTAFGASFGRPSHDIHVMNADGSRPVNLTQNPEVDFVMQPRWSPDGRPISPLGEQFTFVRGNNEVYISRSEGTNAGGIPITSNSSSDPDLHMGPVWSPDSLSVAYVTRRTGTYRIQVEPVASLVRRLD